MREIFEFIYTILLKNILYLGLMFFVAFTLLVASLCFTTASSSSPKVTAAGYQYGIQMDAGSSGTRLYVYKWNERIFHQLPPSLTQVMTEESWSKKQKPGISTFAKNPSGAGASIQPLLDFAINTVLKSEGVTDLSGVRKSTPHILIILFLSAATLPLCHSAQFSKFLRETLPLHSSPYLTYSYYCLSFSASLYYCVRSVLL